MDYQAGVRFETQHKAETSKGAPW